MDKIKVGLAGASGLVGERFAHLLAGHPWFELSCVSASESAIGQNYLDYCKWHLCEPPACFSGLKLGSPKAGTFKDAKIVFSALPPEAAKSLEPELAQAGKIVISNTSVHRREPDIPIIVPEVNSSHLAALELQKKRGWKGCIITGPNCSTSGLVLALKPLQKYGIKTIRVCTLQSISGAGYGGISSIDTLADAIPFISGEEDKICFESKKILGTFSSDSNLSNSFIPADFSAEASCNRIHTLEGHLESVFVELKNKAPAEEIVDLFRQFKGISGLPSAPEPLILVADDESRPRPRLDSKNGRGFAITVGRVRQGSSARSVNFSVLVNNLVRGAAGNGILIAELFKKEGFI